MNNDAPRMKDTVSGVYIIRLRDSPQKAYIGSSADISRRWIYHRWELRAGRHHSMILQRAWDKHGESAFEFCVLQRVEIPTGDRKKMIAALCAAEDAWMALYRRAPGLPPAFNVLPTAGSCLGHTQSVEHKAKIAAAATGRRHTPETKAKISTLKKGKPQPRESTAKSASSRIGRVVSSETRSRISGALTGYKHTPETVAKMTAAFTGRKHSDETKAKLSDLVTGVKRSSEAIAKTKATKEVRGVRISSQCRAAQLAKATGSTRSAETRAKQSESMKRTFAIRRGLKMLSRMTTPVEIIVPYHAYPKDAFINALVRLGTAPAAARD